MVINSLNCPLVALVQIQVNHVIQNNINEEKDETKDV